jgi:hypothetical protein
VKRKEYCPLAMLGDAKPTGPLARKFHVKRLHDAGRRVVHRTGSPPTQVLAIFRRTGPVGRLSCSIVTGSAWVGAGASEE